MKTFTAVSVVSMLVVAGVAHAGECPTTNIIQDPPAFQWTNAGDYWSGTLEIGQATFEIGGETLTTRAYGQGGDFRIPGPTMTMVPGQTYVLTFKNSLPYEEPSPVHNEFKDPNITNIHTHGLHVSGETPGDDVTRLINGGQCGDYVYDVPADHMGGTLWYHAHHHGSTYLQVAAGAFGLLLVDDSGDGIPANVAAMTERQLAIGYLDPSVAGTGGDTLVSGTLSPTWTVNGEVAGQGNLCMPPNEWQHWRVLLADRDARMKTVSVGPECEAVLLARDGVWRTEAPLVLPANAIDLTGASRADLAVRCSADSAISVGNTVVANVFADPALPANLDVGPYSDGATGAAWSAIRPSYLRDLRGLTPDAEQNISMGARTVNGDKFDKDIPSFLVDIPGIQEWTVKGATNHPFHLHVYHMQMNGSCKGFEDGEYYDTIAGSGCLARFDTDPATTSAYDGRTIMHCHILSHEDQGAMTWADVQVGGFGPPLFPDPANQSALYECGASPPPPPTVDCTQFLDRNSCKAEPTCSWSGKTKVCGPA